MRGLKVKMRMSHPFAAGYHPTVDGNRICWYSPTVNRVETDCCLERTRVDEEYVSHGRKTFTELSITHISIVKKAITEYAWRVRR